MGQTEYTACVGLEGWEIYSKIQLAHLTERDHFEDMAADGTI